jgi:glycolate oxidase iron-sulfur subunit
MMLHLDPDELAACVSCGLCLSHCPTFRVTGDEALSPRGRIAAMRHVQSGHLEVTDSFVTAIDTCVQCRGCETACPSGVQFGHLMEGTRQALVAKPKLRYQPRWRQWGYRLLGYHRLVLAAATATAVAQRARLVPPRVGLPPRLPLRRPSLRVASNRAGNPVWLFTGCVMDAAQRHVHQATVTVLEAAGARVDLTGPTAGCCGALAEHAGLVAIAREQAAAVLRAVDGDAPILVNSAGCGAMLADYGRLLNVPAAHAFSARVLDVHTWLADRIDVLVARRRSRPDPSLRIAVHDPCHLRHVQRTHQAVRTVLAPFVGELIELDDDGLCCGAGGAYAAFHPDLAAAIRDRKLAAIRRAGADVVVSANPGCTFHLEAAGVSVRHPLEVVADGLA